MSAVLLKSNMNNHEVIPAILAKTAEEFERMVRILEQLVQRVNLETSWMEIQEYLPLADAVQFMTVNPGFQKQVFMEEVLGKITDFRENNPSIPIMVDGGINPETGTKALVAGATMLVSGSYIVN